jgi:xanthine dehydrogenase accessory factor
MSRFTVEARAAELRAARVPFVMATVVRAERPTSAKAGDRALVLGDGTIEGFVGGTCAESSVRMLALELSAEGAPAGSAVLRIHPDAGPERVTAPDGAVEVHNPCLSGGTIELFLEAVAPAPLLLVHGTAPIARALAAVAAPAGFDVRASDTPAPQIPPDTAAVVVASHGRDEGTTLVAAVRAGVPYVGLVASRRRGAAVLDGLGLRADERAAVHVPAGLDIGAGTPEEVAISILAEIVQVRPRPRPVAAAPSGAEGAVGVATGDATAGPVPATAIDPVCGMAVAAVESSVHADVGGRRVWFCGTGCRDAYVAEPTRYGSPPALS